MKVFSSHSAAGFTANLAMALILMMPSFYAIAQSGNQPFVSTNPRPPNALKPREIDDLGSDIPVDIDQYVWKVKAFNEGESGVAMYDIPPTGDKIPMGSVAVGTVIDTKYVKKFGPKNYYCTPKPDTAGKSNLKPPLNCLWVSGRNIAKSGPAAPAPSPK